MPEFIMTKTLRMFLCVIICLAVFASTGCNKPSSTVSIATDMVDAMANGDFVAATKHYDSTLIKKLSPERLQKSWKLLTDVTGKFIKRNEAPFVIDNGTKVCRVHCRFEKAIWEIVVTIGKSEQISSVMFAPDPTSSNPLVRPNYAKTERFTEDQIVLSRDNYRLRAAVTIPKGKGPYPIVVYVNDAGRSDHDGTVGIRTPYKDIAWGLASQGIAMIRYETSTYSAENRKNNAKHRKTWNVDHEYIYGLNSALRRVSDYKTVDPKRIYLIGQGVGGYLIPMVAQSHPEVAGFIISSGYARRLEDVALDEHRNFISYLDLEKSKALKSTNLMSRDVLAIKSLKPHQKDNPIILDETASFWRNLIGYNPSAFAKSMNKPVLVMHGGRSFKDSIKDHTIWKAAIGTKPNVTMRFYPNLNDYFIQVQGQPSLYDPGIPGFVDAAVINDISNWVKSTSRGF